MPGQSKPRPELTAAVVGDEDTEAPHTPVYGTYI